MVALAALAGLIGDRGGQLVLYTVSVGTHTTHMRKTKEIGSEAPARKANRADAAENSPVFASRYLRRTVRMGGLWACIWGIGTERLVVDSL